MNSIAREAIKDEVRRRGWTFEEVDSDEKYYKITDHRGRSRLGRGGRFMGSSANGVLIAIDKALTYEILASYGFRTVPFVRHQSDALSRAFVRGQGPVVVKPEDGQKSQGVTRGVTTDDALALAVTEAADHSKTGRVVIQKQLEGRLYRVTLIGYEIFAAAWRRPAFVVGDGRQTVGELIDEKNRDPRRSGADRSPLLPIDRDAADAYVGGRLDRVPKPGEEVTLHSIPDLSHGGEAADVTERVNPALAAALERVSRTLGLEVCGFDIIVPDIARYDPDGYLPLLEINTMPGYNFHLNPTAGGVPRDPSPAILDYVFSRSDLTDNL